MREGEGAASAAPVRPAVLLTAREVAVLLAVSAETVLRWSRRGDLPAIRLPSGAIRYRPGDLDVWLVERGRATTARGVSSNPIGRRPRASVQSRVSSNPDHEE